MPQMSPMSWLLLELSILLFTLLVHSSLYFGGSFKGDLTLPEQRHLNWEW